MKYQIKKKNKFKKIVKNNTQDGFSFKPNFKKDNTIKITNLTIYNEECINTLLKQKINKEFKKVASIIIPLLNEDDAGTGDIAIALNELSKHKENLMHKYRKYLSNKEYEMELKRIKVLETELKNKLITIKEQEDVKHR